MVSAMLLNRYFLCVLLLIPLRLSASNIDLATVPPRDQVQLTIYNSEDLTLVRETRRLTFKQGINPLQFSWANTLIDPTSVQLKLPQPLLLLDTTFPHDKPQMLYWNVQSASDQEVNIEISYFTSGVTWAADYLVLADVAEQSLRLESFVRISNQSGEDYENAQIRLVVGTINLVEKIAALANVPVGRVNELKDEEYKGLRQRAARKMLEAPAPAATESAVAGAYYAAAPEPKQIIKEGLSEYFIYSIDGRETVPHGWAKRLHSFTADAASFTVVYRYRPREYGEQLVRLYLLKNDSASQLGTTPLPDGIVRIFHAQADGWRYLATQHLKYVPIGDVIELNLGTDPLVVFTLIKERVYRDNLWLQLRGGDLYRKLGTDNFKLEMDSQVAGWDEHQIYRQEIRNYRNTPIHVELRREYGGDVLFRSWLKPILHDVNTVQFSADIAAGEKAKLQYEVLQRMGYNQKQQRVELRDGAPGN